jgi:predicted aldo/keto reductase-like oxidoreductase
LPIISIIFARFSGSVAAGKWVARWMRSDQDIARVRAGRQEQQQMQQSIQAAPGVAALMNAQNKAAGGK